MGKILVTGFRPYSPLTWLTGNPSEGVARGLGERYGAGAHVAILRADATCLPEVEGLGKLPDLTGVLMFGAGVQTGAMVLETEGVSKADGLLGAVKYKVRSSAAAQFAEYAGSIGVPTASAPARPFVYWCLRSYAAALDWAEPRGIPCLFLHVNVLRVSSGGHLETASRFFERLRKGP